MIFHCTCGAAIDADRVDMIDAHGTPLGEGPAYGHGYCRDCGRPVAGPLVENPATAEGVYPVYDCAASDYTRDTLAIGKAATEAEALALLARHFAGTGADAPAAVVLDDRETRGERIWGYWIAA